MTQVFSALEKVLGRNLSDCERNALTEINKNNDFPLYVDENSALIPWKNINKNVDTLIQCGKVLSKSAKKNKECIVVRYTGACRIYWPCPCLMEA